MGVARNQERQCMASAGGSPIERRAPAPSNSVFLAADIFFQTYSAPRSTEHLHSELTTHVLFLSDSSPVGVPRME
jgi:hypothetical protein